LKKILLTGATGYVGGRLLPILEEKGHIIRCLSKHPENLSHIESERVSTIKADLLDYESTIKAMKGIETAIYLVHALGSKKNFEKLEKEYANNFALAAKHNNVKRIIYLGGLGRGKKLSKHLQSRQETGEILRSSGINTIEFRASIIIGSGSISFELARSLVERLPIVITPKWVHNKAQPIFIEDVLSYLIEAIELATDQNEIFEIGGADQVSYADIMKEYSNQQKLNRIMIPVPLLTPYLSSLWLGLITPVYADIGMKLIEGVKNPTIVEDHRAREVFNIDPRGLQESIKLALEEEKNEFRQTYWASAFSTRDCTGNDCLNLSHKNYKYDVRTIKVMAEPARTFACIQKIGGKNGWYYADYLWRLRGFIDLMLGGVGLRRGRRDPVDLKQGDIVDWWRVELFEQDKLLRLRTEMILPGAGWLEFSVKPLDRGCELTQTVIFYPRGFQGILYWYALKVPHNMIFSNMLKNIKKEIEKGSCS
jgi:uncharacterized protein YbjT (DUF2867 family)